MTKMVRAAVMLGPGRLEVREFPMPEPEPGAVLLKMQFSGVCGTDKHTYRGETKQYAGTPHERDVPFPIIPGHENVGFVAATGGEVRDFDGTLLREGDRVVPAANITCGHCYYCKGDFPYYMCEHLDDYGNSLSATRAPHLFGGWSEYMYILPGTHLYRVPDDLPSHIAVLTEVMSVTAGLDKAKEFSSPSEGFRFGDTVVVQGVGPLGLCHVVKARLLGAGDIIAIDTFSSRLEMARRCGADYALNLTQTTSQERIEQVRAWTHGRGADVVVDCSGVAHAVPEGLEMTRAGGMFIEVGAFVDMGPVPINPNLHFCIKNIRLLGIGGEAATAYGPTMKVLAKAQHHYPLDQIVTHRFGLDHAEEAIKTSMSDGAMKVVIGAV
jgi:threonine dehydrogenase-like Zn-dependent dehydrogenase